MVQVHNRSASHVCIVGEEHAVGGNNCFRRQKASIAIELAITIAGGALLNFIAYVNGSNTLEMGKTTGGLGRGLRDATSA